MNDELRLILQRMQALTEHDDPEAAHIVADQLIIRALRDIAGRQGCETSFLLISIADAFDGLKKWY